MTVKQHQSQDDTGPTELWKFGTKQPQEENLSIELIEQLLNPQSLGRCGCIELGLQSVWAMAKTPNEQWVWLWLPTDRTFGRWTRSTTIFMQVKRWRSLAIRVPWPRETFSGMTLGVLRTSHRNQFIVFLPMMWGLQYNQVKNSENSFPKYRKRPCPYSYSIPS